MADFVPLDVAYAAGIIDGEGCIGVTEVGADLEWRGSVAHRRRRVSPQFRAYVAVVMSVPTVPLWLRERFGGWLYTYQPRKANHKPPHRWCMSGADAVDFCRLIIPYLRLKREQAELLVAFWERRKDVVNPRSKGPSGEEIERRRSVVLQFHSLNKRGVA